MTDRGRSQKYYYRDRFYSRDRSQKYYDRNKSCKMDRLPKYYKNNYEESIIIHFRTMEIGEYIKIIIRTNIGIKISMIMIDPMIQIILMAEIGHMTDTGHIVETGTTLKNTKETGHMLEIDYMTKMIHIVEIDCKTMVEMSIRRKIINIREDLENIMRMPMRTGMVGININTNTEMTDMTKLEVDQRKNHAYMVIKIVIVFIQNLKNCIIVQLQ